MKESKDKTAWLDIAYKSVEPVTMGIYPPLTTSVHRFKSGQVEAAYEDLGSIGLLESAGVAMLKDIPSIKAKMLQDLTNQHVPILLTDKSGYYYLRKLSKSQRNKFLKAFKAEQNAFPVSYWLESKFSDYEEFLQSSFKWDETPEGDDYWRKIADKARWGTRSASNEFIDQIFNNINL